MMTHLKISHKKSLFYKQFLSFCLVLLCTLNLTSTALAEDIVAIARVWPAQDYTRITLESAQALNYKMSVVKAPDRIVVDIENVDLKKISDSLSDKMLASDPYIKKIRVARFQKNTVRLVIDLKAEAKPKAFTLTPTANYKNRLVLDVYPLKDPLMTMVEQRDVVATTQYAEKSATAERPAQIEPTIKNEPQPQVMADKGSQFPANEAITGTSEAMGRKANTSSEAKASETTTAQPVENNQNKTKKNERQIVIAIDAGHGGEDPGARGANGSREKDVTLMVAKKLKEKIDSEPNMRAVLTRESDFFIPLHGRVVKARNMQADLFVSIHADAFTNQSAKGSSVFVLSERGATSASARYLAKKENESDLIGGVSLDDKEPLLAKTLLDLSQTATINDSLKLGKAVLTQIGAINSLHAKHVEQAAFAVLKSPDIPSILVETAFISNPDEERKLNDTDHQDKLVAAILSGIKKYFSTNPSLAKTSLASE